MIKYWLPKYWSTNGCGNCADDPTCSICGERSSWFFERRDTLVAVYRCYRHLPPMAHHPGYGSLVTDEDMASEDYGGTLDVDSLPQDDDGSIRPCPRCGATANYYMVGWWCPLCDNLERAP